MFYTYLRGSALLAQAAEIIFCQGIAALAGCPFRVIYLHAENIETKAIKCAKSFPAATAAIHIVPRLPLFFHVYSKRRIFLQYTTGAKKSGIVLRLNKN